MTRKIILALALLTMGVANAATYYRDRLIPAGAPCMIAINSSYVNALMIKSVRVGDYEFARRTGKTSEPWENYTKKSMRVTLINGDTYDTFENQEAALADVLKKIENCSK